MVTSNCSANVLNLFYKVNYAMEHYRSFAKFRLVTELTPGVNL